DPSNEQFLAAGVKKLAFDRGPDSWRPRRAAPTRVRGSAVCPVLSLCFCTIVHRIQELKRNIPSKQCRPGLIAVTTPNCTAASHAASYIPGDDPRPQVFAVCKVRNLVKFASGPSHGRPTRGDLWRPCHEDPSRP